MATLNRFKEVEILDMDDDGNEVKHRVRIQKIPARAAHRLALRVLVTLLNSDISIGGMSKKDIKDIQKNLPAAEEVVASIGKLDEAQALRLTDEFFKYAELWQTNSEGVEIFVPLTDSNIDQHFYSFLAVAQVQIEVLKYNMGFFTTDGRSLLNLGNPQ